MRKAGKLFIGALSVGALVGTGYPAWTVNYGGATKVDKEVNPVFDTELVINGAGLVVTDKETELNFTEEADADFEISYYVSPSNTNWYDHIYADDAAVDINVTVSGVNNKADDSWKEYIVAPTAEIGYEDWLGADAKTAGKYEVNLTFAWNEAKPSERWASLTPAEQEVNYRAMLEAVAGLKFVVTFELYSMPRVVTSVTLDKQLLELSDRDNKTGKLVATVLPEKAADKSLTWISENAEVATVDQEGNVTAVGVGETVIKATSVNNIFASATVRVTHDLLPISFSASGDVNYVEINATYLTDDAGWQEADLKANDLSYLIGKKLNLNVQAIENYVLDSVKVIATKGEANYPKDVEITPNGASYEFTVEEGFDHKIEVAAHLHGSTEADPLTIDEANTIGLGTAGTATEEKYYVKGVVTGVQYSTKFSNYDYVYFKTLSGADFSFYQFKNINNTTFTSENAIAVGDVVTGYGSLSMYSGKAQMAKQGVLVEQTKVERNVEVTLGEHVSATEELPAKLERFSSKEIKVNFEEGYRLAEVTGATLKEGTTDTFVINMLNEDLTVSITAELIPTTLQTVTLSASASSVKVGESVTLSVETDPADWDKSGVTYAITEGSSYATIESGALKGVAKGTVKVQATIDNVVSNVLEIEVKEAGEAEPVTETVVFADVQEEYGWTNSTQYSSFNICNDIITITMNGGANTGKYYDNGENFRIYGGESGTFTVSSATGYKIVSLSITFVTSKTSNFANYTSGSLVNVDGSTYTFSTTGTSGYAGVSSITVTYQAI